MIAPKQGLKAGAATDPGHTRANNEDSFGLPAAPPALLARRGALYLVCDGMGGHAAGEIASRIAVDTVMAVYYEAKGGDPRRDIQHAIAVANSRIRAEAEGDAGKQGMGCTLVAALTHPQGTWVFNVGDSRAYLLHSQTLRRVSDDHSWIGEQIRANALTAEQARRHPMRNIISRALGTADTVEADVFDVAAQPGDVILLCTDGVWESLEDDQLLRILLDKRADPQAAADEIIRQANAAGADDNITAIVVPLPAHRSGGRSLRRWLILLVLLAAATAAALWLSPALWDTAREGVRSILNSVGY